jgi:hypothetical protein
VGVKRKEAWELKGRKPGSKGKGIGRVQAKRKPESDHILPGVQGSARECEGVSTHTPKATPILGEVVPVDSRNFRGQVEKSNLNELLRFWYRWKIFET